MWLIFHLLIVAVLAVSVEVFCRAARPRPAVSHLLWLAVLIKLMTPPLVAWPWTVDAPAVLERIAVVEFFGDTGKEAAGKSEAGSMAAAAAAKPARAAEPLAVDLVSAGIGIWIVGAGLAALLQALRSYRLKRTLRPTFPAPRWLTQLASETACRMSVRAPRVFLAEGAHSALALNPLRPKVLISPALIAAVPREDLAAVLAHEMAHLKRRDLWSGLLETLGECAWWWNPLLYLIKRRLHLYREMAADAWALSVLPEGRRAYAETLVRAVDLASRRPAFSAAFGMAGGPAVYFERRLRSILGEAVPCRVPRAAVATTLVLLVLVTPGWSSAGPGAGEAPGAFDQSPAPESSTETPAIVAEVRAFRVARPSKLSFNAERYWNYSGEQFLALITGPLKPSDLVIDGDSVVTEGGELQWGDNRQPAGDEVNQLFSATVGLCRGFGTVITSGRIGETSAAPNITRIVLQPEEDGVHAWIKKNVDKGPLSSTYYHLVLPAQRNEWSAAVMSAPTAEGSAILLLFFKFQDPTPELIERIEVGDTDDCKVELSSMDTADGARISAEFKFIEMSQAEFEKAEPFFVLSEDSGGKDALVRRVQDSEAVCDMLSRGNAELLAAPRVKFALGSNEAKVLQRNDEPFDDVLNSSEALKAFWEEAHPAAVIAHVTSEPFKGRGGKVVYFNKGFVAEIAAGEGSTATSVEGRILVDKVGLRRRGRGLPEATSNPVEVAFECGYGEELVWEIPSSKPGRRRLVFVQFTEAEGRTHPIFTPPPPPPPGTAGTRSYQVAH